MRRLRLHKIEAGDGWAEVGGWDPSPGQFVAWDRDASVFLMSSERRHLVPDAATLDFELGTRGLDRSAIQDRVPAAWVESVPLGTAVAVYTPPPADEPSDGKQPDNDRPADDRGPSFAPDRGHLTKVVVDDGRGARAIWGWANGAVLAPRGAPVLVTLPELDWWVRATTDARSRYLNEFVGPASAHGFNGGSMELMGDIHRHGPTAWARLVWLVREIHARGGMVHLWWAADAERAGEGRWNRAWLPGGPEWPSLSANFQHWLGSVPGWSLSMGFDTDEYDPDFGVRRAFASQLNDRIAIALFGARPHGPNPRGWSSWGRLEPSTRGLDIASTEAWPNTLLAADEGLWAWHDREFAGKPRLIGEDRLGSQGDRWREKRAGMGELIQIAKLANRWRSGVIFRWWDRHDRGPRSGTRFPDPAGLKEAIWSRDSSS